MSRSIKKRYDAMVKEREIVRGNYEELYHDMQRQNRQLRADNKRFMKSREALEAQVARLTGRLQETVEELEVVNGERLEYIHALGQVVQCDDLLFRARKQKDIARMSLYGDE